MPDSVGPTRESTQVLVRYLRGLLAGLPDEELDETETADLCEAADLLRRIVECCEGDGPPDRSPRGPQ